MLSRKILIAYFLFISFRQSNSETKSNKFLRRRDGFRIPERLAWHLHENVGDLQSCLALCSQEYFCLAASFKSTERPCYTSQQMFSFSSIEKLLEAETGWVTMSKAFYPVYLAESPLGNYLTFKEGVALCEEEGSEIATRAHLIEAYSLGLSMCFCGWVADETKVFIVNEGQALTCQMPSTPGQVTTCPQSFDKANVWCLLK